MSSVNIEDGVFEYILLVRDSSTHKIPQLCHIASRGTYTTKSVNECAVSAIAEERPALAFSSYVKTYSTYSVNKSAKALMDGH